MVTKPPKPAKKVIGDLDFDKGQWLKDMKMLAKEAMFEERDRFRPLVSLKRESKEALDELERLEKKYEIGLMRERD